MINFLLGAPGGGKSYEAVVYHVLPALAKGRKVITNLPLDVEQFALIDASYPGLLDLRKETRAVRPAPAPDVAGGLLGRWRAGVALSWNMAAFSHVEDYADPWRHPETGAGPLYVIDECHACLPRNGTPIAVEEWFALHRHEFADVLLLSQSYGKVNQAVRDLVQIVYRVRKNTALGSNSTYTRKVQDGLRGAEVNSAIRKYEKRYFPLYRSHTRSGEGVEMGASDVRPIWQNWAVYGVGVSIVVFLGIVIFNGNPFRIFKSKPLPATVTAMAPVDNSRLGIAVPAAVREKVPAPAPAVVKSAPAEHWPYGALELHVGGFIKSARREMAVIVFSQNGQKVFAQSSWDLARAGYGVQVMNPCLVRLTFGKLSQFISCDVPQLGVDVAGARLPRS